MTSKKISLQDKNVYDIIDNVINFYIENLHSKKLFDFLTKKSNEECIAENFKCYWDTTREKTQLIAIKTHDLITLCLDKKEILFNLGFRFYDNSWVYPENDSKLIAFAIHLDMYYFKSRSKLKT